MSAERPEVGDVWKMNGSLVHVKKIMKRPDRAVVAFENLSQTTLLTKQLIKACTYIGKSKASIKDLFSVKENAKQALNNESEE